ncbi:MAG: tetratricopeptide repeat protein, partial [Bryobacterales bacterium]|nr:tetratricopeptide repeat protein [Bryobacterales bacterium]
MHHSELGDHAAAIQRLREALARYPQAAPYTLTLLGAELVATRSYGDARNAFELVVRALPHESAAHANYGLSLALAGNADAAEKELRQAVALDHENGKAKRILEAVLVSKRIPGERAAALPPLPVGSKSICPVLFTRDLSGFVYSPRCTSTAGRRRFSGFGSQERNSRRSGG